MFLTTPTNVYAKIFLFFLNRLDIEKNVKSPAFYMLEKTKETKGIVGDTSVGTDKESICKMSEKINKLCLNCGFIFFRKKTWFLLNCDKSLSKAIQFN